MPIDMISPKLESIVSLGQEIEELGSGYLVAEGPLWWREEGYLLFNEVRGNHRRNRRTESFTSFYMGGMAGHVGNLRTRDKIFEWIWPNLNSLIAADR